MFLKSLTLIGSMFCAEAALATLTLDKVPPEIKLEDKLGGRVVGGGAWSSAELMGKVHVLFYVAPEAEDLNGHVRDLLKEQNFPSEKFASIAIINMAASPALPNFMISSRLKKKQEANPRTTFVEDKKKILVKEWNLADHSSCVLAFNKEGKVIFSIDGKLSDQQIQDLLGLIKGELAEKPAQKFETKQADTHTNTQNKK